MKIGVCLFGHIGQISTWKDGIHEKDYDFSGLDVIYSDLTNPIRRALSKHEVKFFVHTWSADVEQKITEAVSPDRLQAEKPKNFFLIKQLKNHFCRSGGWRNPFLFTYNLFYSYPKNKKLYWLRRMNAGMSRWYSTRRSLELLEEYEKENSIKFDHIISTRLDLVFRKKLNEGDILEKDFLTLANFNTTPSIQCDPDFINNTFNKNKCSDLIFSGPRDRIMRLKEISLNPDRYSVSPHKSSFEVLFLHPKDYKNVKFKFYPWIDLGTFKSEYADWKIDK